MIKQNMSRDEVEQSGRSGATKSDIAKVLNSFYIKTDKDEQSVGQWLANDGFWESWITSWMTKNIRPGYVCLDIGANYGYYTRIMETLSTSTGSVFAVEANPELCRTIKESISEYPIENSATVNICNVAVSDSKGMVTLNIPPKYIGGSSIVWGKQDLPSDLEESLWTDKIEIESDTIDNLFSHVDHINLIKIDIEGAEPLAWSGMQETIKKTDIIIMEIGNYLPSSFIDELYNLYEISIVEGDGFDRIISRDEFNKLDDLIMGVLRKR